MGRASRACRPRQSSLASGLLFFLCMGMLQCTRSFDSEWTRLWTTEHDGDDAIEKELLTRLAHSKEEHFDMESSFCSARYYKPLIGFGSYGSQILSLAPHIITAKLTRRILLLESFRGVNSPQRGEEIKYGKMLDPEGATTFVGTVVTSDEFAHCAGASGGGGSTQRRRNLLQEAEFGGGDGGGFRRNGIPVGGRRGTHMGGTRSGSGGRGKGAVKHGGVGGAGMWQALGPKGDLLFKYGTTPACSTAEGRYLQVWDRDEFLRQCSGVPHGVSANTWARAMWLISNGEATEPTAMAAFALCPAVRSKEVVTFCARSVVPTLDLPVASKGIFGSGGGASDSFGSALSGGRADSDFNRGSDGDSQWSGSSSSSSSSLSPPSSSWGRRDSLRSRFSNASTACLRHFLDPEYDDDNGATKVGETPLTAAQRRKRQRLGGGGAAGVASADRSQAVNTYCRMIRQSVAALGANLWTVRLGKWLVGEIKTAAAHASSQAARWSSERKALQAQEADEDAKLEEDKKEEIAARAEMERKRAIRQAEAQAPGTGGYRNIRNRRNTRRLTAPEIGVSSQEIGVSSQEIGNRNGEDNERLNNMDLDREIEDEERTSSALVGAKEGASNEVGKSTRRTLLAKSRPDALPPSRSKSIPPSRGFVLGLHLRLTDCYTSADPANSAAAARHKRNNPNSNGGNRNGVLGGMNGVCGENSKGFLPEHVPLIIRGVTRLITDRAVPAPAAIFVASNFAGIFKLLPRELWHAHGVTRLFGWTDLQDRLGGEFRDHNIVALEHEILRFADGGLVAGLHSNMALWTAARRWRGFGDEMVPFGDNKHNPLRPSRAVIALEQVHLHEEQVAQTSMALTGRSVSLFNDTTSNAVCLDYRGPGGAVYPPNACACVAMRQEYGVVSGKSFGSLPKLLHRSWAALRCDAVLCETLRPRDAAAARAGEKFPCKRKFYDDVMKFPPKKVKKIPNHKKKKRKVLKIG